MFDVEPAVLAVAHQHGVSQDVIVVVDVTQVRKLPLGTIVALRFSHSGEPELVRIDPQSGATTRIAGGPPFIAPTAIVVEPDQNILVADPGAAGGAVIRVDPATGACTQLTAGQMLREPWDIALDAHGALVVADRLSSTGAGALVGVDRVSGTQSMLAAGGIGFREPFRSGCCRPVGSQ